jgi:hypothetical protein
MLLLHTFHWFEATGIGTFGRRSAYFFPVIEVVHLLGLTLLLGTVLLLNLKLLGAIMRRQSVAEIARATTPLLCIGAALALASGALLFLTEAVKCYYNIAFWYKMALLFLAIVFQLVVHPRLRVAPAVSQTSSTPLLKCTAAASLVLWFGVAVAGRAIAFV